MRRQKRLLALTGLALAITGTGLYFLSSQEDTTNKKPPRIRSSYSPKAQPNSSEGRDAYFFNMLRDPATNQIPAGIQAKEAALYEAMPKNMLKSGSYTWSEAGPNDVGGRTRALAIDVRNSNVILAGGVSGGVWKSTDKGASWTLKNTPAETYSVTSICQDPREGHQDTWYYAGGEWDGNSASAESTPYRGHGIYKSIDNGETWEMILGNDNNALAYDTYRDYISRIQVDPATGYLILAAHGYGLLLVREEATGYVQYNYFGGGNNYTYSDFDFDKDGNLIVVLSENGSNPKKYTPGVYYKGKDDTNFTQIDPTSTTFPTIHERSVIRFAPSNSTIAYVLTHQGNKVMKFHKIDVTAKSLIDRSSNLPAFTINEKPVRHGKLGEQANYNMTLAVKPDDPNFVVVGSTSLFRSADAFASALTDDINWIGGYNSDTGSGSYPNHHADCHNSVFDPNDANALWSGHDGGLSYTNNISNTSAVSWESKNNGYNVTQFFTLANLKANDERYMGGAQDNGTPFFRYDTNTSISKNVGSGDGSYCYLGENYTYISPQRGHIIRTKIAPDGTPYSAYIDSPSLSDYSNIIPTDAKGQLFINPFVINPNNENVMYYAGGEQLWINKEIESIPAKEDSTMIGWEAPTSLDVSGYSITTLAISSQPANVLYYGAYNSSATPKIFRVNNSTADAGSLARTDISIPEATGGSYPYCIAVNPADANEIIVVFSNYNVPSIFHSTDGGVSYNKIDGNLSNDAFTTDPTATAVSIRSASIHNWNDKKIFYISTSIGLYSTETLNGESTIWTNVAPNLLGNVVCNVVKTSDTDGRVVTATHGRGIFVGKPTSATFIDNPESQASERFTVYPNPATGPFKIKAPAELKGTVQLQIFTLNGKEVYHRQFSSIEEVLTNEFEPKQSDKGLYLVRLLAEGYDKTQKLRVE